MARAKHDSTATEMMVKATIPPGKEPRVRGWRWTAVATAFLILFLFPLWLMASASLQPGVSSATVQWFPTAPQFDGYGDALAAGGLGGLLVSLVVSVCAVALTLVIAIPAAFALSRLRSRGVSIAMTLLLLAQMIPGVVLTLSFYSMFNSWGLLNSIVGLVLANCTASIPFAVILMRSFMYGIDTEIMEAAQLDGVGPIGNLIRIVVPISRNSVITAAVFTFLFTWGDLLFGLTLVTRTEMYPMTVVIFNMTTSPLNQWAAVMAASLLASIPAFFVVFGLQRYVKEGVAAGSGK
ncbi:carbohydrate ABC transporter permease [Microbacterium sp.]|uniref:carbohydrate ABC transporter permease n=1 Tax=Microbacterium sp. TaxID=51671 RepID=UPI003C7324A3